MAVAEQTKPYVTNVDQWFGDRYVQADMTVHLTDREAKYPLLSRSIRPKGAPTAKPDDGETTATRTSATKPATKAKKA